MVIKAIWLVAGGPMQHIVAKKIKELGYHLIVSDGIERAYCKELADTFIHSDTFDIDRHLKFAKSIEEKFKICAVLTSAADCHSTVSVLAKYFNVHHLDLKISEVCRNKLLTRNALRNAGLLQPQSYQVSNLDEANAILLSSQCAFVMKASDSSGSRGFVSLDQGCLVTNEQFNYSKSSGTKEFVILEERLEPSDSEVSEASVETVWFNGKMYWLNWVDRIFPRDLRLFPEIKITQNLGPAIEIGHLNPAKHEISVKEKVAADIFRAGVAIGMANQTGGHILKADIFFSSKGPVILELTPRTSGGWDSSGSSMVRGANIPEGVIYLALGGAVDLDCWHKYFTYKDSERNVAVMSLIPDNAIDCTGRKFTMSSSYTQDGNNIEEALLKIKKGEFFVPVY